MGRRALPRLSVRFFPLCALPLCSSVPPVVKHFPNPASARGDHRCAKATLASTNAARFARLRYRVTHHTFATTTNDCIAPASRCPSSIGIERAPPSPGSLGTPAGCERQGPASEFSVERFFTFISISRCIDVHLRDFKQQLQST